MRSAGSAELDTLTLKNGDRVPKFERWDKFRQLTRLRQGESVTIVGTTGSGKTLLARELLRDRDYVMVLGTKRNDPELYPEFEAAGFQIVEEFDPEPAAEQSHIIFRPRRTDPSEKGKKAQREAFEAALFEVWEVGRWTVYADELVILTSQRQLNLTAILEELYIAGRSDKITIFASTQKPVDVPLVAFDQAVHLFLFANADRYRINRMAEFTGRHVEMARWLIPRLPPHEFLYVNTRTGQALRSMVIK